MEHPCGLFHTTKMAFAHVSLRFAALIGCRSIQLSPEAFWSEAFDNFPLKLKNERFQANVPLRIGLAKRLR